MNGSTLIFQIPLFKSGEQMQKAGGLEEINSLSPMVQSVMDFFCQREKYFQPVTATHYRYKVIQLYWLHWNPPYHIPHRHMYLMTATEEDIFTKCAQFQFHYNSTFCEFSGTTEE